MNLKVIVLIGAILSVSACGFFPGLDDVISDERKEYRKSEALPDLEVPPDLTREGLDDPLLIPNEEATTLSEFERQKSQRRLGAAPVGALPSGVSLNDNSIILQGSKARIWPELRKFWQENGYELELDDPDLGVMETQWKETGASGGLAATRSRYTLFTEDASTPGNILVLLSNEQQEQIAGEEGTGSWISVANNTEQEQQIVSELNLYFYGAPSEATALASTSDEAASAVARAEVLDLGDEKLYLSMPEEFTRAWRLTEDALLKSGLLIESQDRSKGLYSVLYYVEVEEKEKGFFSKLAFWSDDEPEAMPYQISLTGVGDKTELVVLDEEGEWEKGPNANRILGLLQAQYNGAR